MSTSDETPQEKPPTSIEAASTEFWEDAMGSPRQKVLTGFTDLDDVLDELGRSHLILVASRPSMGKTAFALNMLEAITIDQKLPALYVSLESQRRDVAARLTCSRASVDSHRLRWGMLSAEDHQKLAETVGTVAYSPLHVISAPRLAIDEFCDLTRQAVAKYGVRLVCVDYAQLLRAPGDNRTEELSRVSRDLKALAMELDLPVMALSQMNRGWEAQNTGFTGNRLTLKDLRGSGTLEDEADVVLIIHREDYYHSGEEDYQPTNTADIIVAKQRNGPTGTVELVFDGKCTRFRSKA